MLDVVSGARTIAATMRLMRRRLAGMTVRNVSISWHGGGAVRGDIVWLRDERFWWRHDAARFAGRHSLMFGYAPEVPALGESATCEINLPAVGIDRRLGGAIARDAEGKLYLAHSGKIGGGRSGRHREAFRAFLAGGNWQKARWPDGHAGELLLVAPLDGARLAQQIGHFVHAVHRYKRQDADGRGPWPAALGPADAALAATADGAALASLCDRATLLDALAEELTRRGLPGTSARGDPLFAVRGNNARLIELATDTSGPSLERSIGRLLLRAAAAGETPHAVLVVPDVAAPPRLAALARHGVAVVRYRWRGMRPVFLGLDSALG
jgi:hypothetical protein